MDKMVGPDFEKGLARLKDVVETRPPCLTPTASPEFGWAIRRVLPPWARMAGR